MFNLGIYIFLDIFAEIENFFKICDIYNKGFIGMKTKQERIEYYKHLIKRKESIRARHLFVIKKHLSEVEDCEAYIEKYTKMLKKLSDNLEI